MTLLPAGELLDALARDYKAMQDAGMFYGEALPFPIIVDRLQSLEDVINMNMASARPLS